MAKKSKKVYVIDTNVFLSDFNAVYAFADNDIIVPLKVLEEIDKHKKRQDSVGVNARQVIRIFDQLREKGQLDKGVKIGGRKGTLIVKDFVQNTLPAEMNISDPDNQILATVKSVMAEEGREGRTVYLVSQDINMRVKADALGIPAQDYTTNKIVELKEEIYTGFTSHLVDDHLVDRFYAGEKLFLEEKDIKLHPNQYVMLVSNANEKKTALCKFRNYNFALTKVREFKEGIWDVRAKNKEQQFAFDLLMDDNIKIVSLVGLAGCGKTLIALAAALEQTLGDQGNYKKIIVSRPVQPMGRDIGFLPGPQPLDAKILTPNGWTTMGSLKVGDKIIGHDGNPTKVLDIFPKGKKAVYKFVTSDGSSTECCEDHLWLTKTANERKHSKEGQVRSTKEIISSLKTSNGKINHFLPRVLPVHYIAKELPISPYVLGVLLGDGCIKDSVAICNTDLELIKRVEREIKDLGCTLENNGKSIVYNIKAHLFNNKPAKQVHLTHLDSGTKEVYDSIGKALEFLDINRSTLQSRCENKSEIDGKKYEYVDNTNRWQNPVKNALSILGLENKKAYEKFIPEIYKYSSIEDRIFLLQGLMDTDGCVKKTGEASFTTTSLQLAKDVQEIVRSLGGRAVLKERNRVGKKTIIDGREVISRRVSYEFTISLPSDINPFYISRKADRHSTKYIQGVGVESVEMVGEKEVQCILVENDKHLYVTDEFIVTHNTLEEKMAPWVAPIQDNLEFLMGDDKEHLQMLQEKGTIEVEALTFIRGRSIANAFIIIDEAQNLTMHELKTIITRVGEGTKIVLTGDIEQIDSAFLDATNNGLTYAVEKFKPYELTGHVTLLKGERSSVASLAASVL